MVSRRWLPLSNGGFTYVEALAALVLTAVLMLGLMRTLGNVLDAHDGARIDHDGVEESRYALERMVRAVSRSRQLLVPLAENPGTSHTESVRDPGVLAITLDATRDLDADGVADADNDADGRFDEDADKDRSFDNAAGIVGIDDDGDGSVDEGAKEDDDEDGGTEEDALDLVDNDGDGSIDEDTDDDMTSDGKPGIAGIDDDGDASIDEGNNEDDDEDGVVNEDWWDVVVFYQSGAKIVERIPVPWDESGDSLVSGLDFVERTIATNIVQFHVERVPSNNGGPPLVEVRLVRNDVGGQPQTLQTTIKLGGGL